MESCHVIDPTPLLGRYGSGTKPLQRQLFQGLRCSPKGVQRWKCHDTVSSFFHILSALQWIILSVWMCLDKIINALPEFMDQLPCYDMQNGPRPWETHHSLRAGPGWRRAGTFGRPFGGAGLYNLMMFITNHSNIFQCCRLNDVKCLSYIKQIVWFILV